MTAYQERESARRWAVLVIVGIARASGYRLEDVADALGISRSVVYNWRTKPLCPATFNCGRPSVHGRRSSYRECIFCGARKPKAEFRRRHRFLLPYCNCCAKTRNAASRLRYLRDREYYLARSREWRRANPAKANAASAAWKQRNPEKRRAYLRRRDQKIRSERLQLELLKVASKL